MRLIFPLILALYCNSVFALSIQHVSHSPTNIDLNSTNGVNVRFNIDAPTAVQLKIYDDRDYLVRTVSSGSLEQGDNQLYWDGKDDFGKFVPAEAYHYTLVAGDVIHDVTDLFTSNKNTLTNIEWDREKGTVSYLLTKNSRVNIHAGLTGGGPLLTTVINWLPRRRGTHVEAWDGIGSNNKFNIAKIPKADIFTETYSFPANTIIVGENISQSQYVTVPDDTEKRKRSTKKVKVLFDQSGKNADNRADYGLSIELPKAADFKEGVPVYKKNIAVKISVPKEDLQRMSRDRFEPILFVDGEYVSEIESGFLPITWQLDIKDLTEGKHFVTVNIRGYDGQYGAVSKSIYIQK